MLAHVLASARELAPARITVVVGHGADRVKQAFGGQEGLHFALQQPQQGTGHAVQQAVPLLLEGDGKDDVTLVLYGDVPLVQPDTLRRLLAARGDGAAVLTEVLDDSTGYGRIVRDAAGQVCRIVEHKDASEAERAIKEVNTGILAAPTARLKDWLSRIDNNNAQGEYYLTDVIGLAVTDGVPVGAAQPAASWETLGVNSRVQQAELERRWQAEQARRQLEAGVTLADPARFDLRGTLRCGRDVFIDVGCVFEGEVTLADGVRVGPHCVLRDVSVGAGTQIEAYSHLQDAQVGRDARVGYARLRPGAELGDRSHVGNFVEIKKSVLGADSKANHLAYIGDAEIGARVNVGAGTITCNYDGVNKHRTVIEDDAFIGSDTQLVAPVRVGQGATLGAGTTLTRDAPAGKLTVSRAKQLTVEGWQRPTKSRDHRGADRHAGRFAAGRPAGARRYWAAATVMTGISLSVLDTTIANVALPTIAADLQSSPAQAVWVVNAYNLAVVTMLLPLSALAERIGFRRMFTFGLVLFTLASLGCALAGTLVQLTLARVFQGVGAATLMCLFGGLVRNIYPLKMLGRGISINATTVAVMSVLGPTIGSAILSVAPWPWIFAVNLPVCVLAMLGLRHLPEVPRNNVAFDGISALLSMATLGVFISGVDMMGADLLRGIGLVAIAAVLGIVLMRRASPDRAAGAGGPAAHPPAGLCRGRVRLHLRRADGVLRVAALLFPAGAGPAVPGSRHADGRLAGRHGAGRAVGGPAVRPLFARDHERHRRRHHGGWHAVAGAAARMCPMPPFWRACSWRAWASASSRRRTTAPCCLPRRARAPPAACKPLPGCSARASAPPWSPSPSA